MRSAYVHIPFCARICPYCDFNVVAGRDELIDRYIDALVTEITAEESWGHLDAVFVGGGTPSRLSPSKLETVIEALDRRFGIDDCAEITLEANPEDWDRTLSDELVSIGFTRVSFGAQSFDPQTLSYLGRVHRPEDVIEAVSIARESGFRSVNLDLIFGSPRESLTSWKRTLDAALALEPDHLSLYSLTVERGTALSRLVAAGDPAPDPDRQADAYELAEAVVTGAGLRRYEISNFARDGHACLYNLAVWGHGDYLGFGAGAHSFRKGVRRRNIRRLDAYIARVTSGIGGVQGVEVLDDTQLELERLMLGLRRSAGVKAGPLGERFLCDPSTGRLIEAGLITQTGDRLVILRPMLTDAVVAELLRVVG